MVLANTMDVLVDTTIGDTRKVVVDDMHHVLDIQTARRNPGSNQDRRPGSTEGAATAD